MITSAMRQARLNMSLEAKEDFSIKRIIATIRKFGVDGVYMALSGKDSEVMKHLTKRACEQDPFIRKMVEGVFCDTGVEIPEVESFRNDGETTIVKPDIDVMTVNREFGLPLVSKKVSRRVRDCQSPTQRNANTIRLYCTGINRDGKFTGASMLSKKWRFLVFEYVKISEQCCAILKKAPMKAVKKVPMIGVMAGDSSQRANSYKEHGCLFFDSKKPQSRPIMFWTEEDILAYIVKYGLKIPSVYGEVVNGVLTGEKRTGCFQCAFGADIEQRIHGVSRYERMKETHPKRWKAAIYGMGMGKWLGMCGVRTGDPMHEKYYDKEKINFYAKMSNDDFHALVWSRDKSKMHPRSLGYNYLDENLFKLTN